MGVQARIVLYAPDTTTARTAAIAAFDRIAELDGIMSDYRRDSELMQLSAHAGTGPVRVSDDLFEILWISRRLAEQSDGAFDVTVSPIVRLWRETRRSGKLPAPGVLDSARARVGWHLMNLDPDARTVDLTVPGMQLDLGGIAKGYAADAAIAALAKHGVKRGLVEFGGDVVAGDPPPGTDGWAVTASLADPEKQHLRIANQAVSTSGDTQQFIEIDGKRYSHVVDPRTGIGLTSRAAATVVAPSGTLSDALATTLSILGPEPGNLLVRRHYPDVTAHVRYLTETTAPQR